MAEFHSHIEKAKSNLRILKEINAKVNNSLDWQITVCFYTALHVIDAYLANESDLHYNTHKEVDLAINPYNQLSTTKIEFDIYKHYQKLFNLSRMSRYMCSNNHETRKSDNGLTHVVNDKDLKKAIVSLNIILSHFDKKYSLEFPITELLCREFGSNHQLDYFLINKNQSPKSIES